MKKGTIMTTKLQSWKLNMGSLDSYSNPVKLIALWYLHESLGLNYKAIDRSQ